MAGTETNLMARLGPQFINHAAAAAGTKDCDSHLLPILRSVLDSRASNLMDATWMPLLTAATKRTPQCRSCRLTITGLPL